MENSEQSREEAIPHQPEADTFDVRAALLRIWETALVYWWLLVVTPIVAVLCVLLYVKIWPPTYVATAVLMSEAPVDPQRDNFYLYWNIFRKDDLNSEVEMVYSRAVLEPIIRELDLQYEDVYHPPMSYLVHLWGESWVGSNYRKIKKFFFPPKPSPFTPTEEEIEFVRVLNDLRAGISFTPIPDTTIGELSVKGPSPRVARVANLLADRFMSYRIERFKNEAVIARDALREQVHEVQNELAKIEQARIDYAQENTLYLDFEEEKLDLGTLNGLKASLIDLGSQLVGFREKREEIVAGLASEPERVMQSEVKRESAIHSQIKSQISNLRAQRKLTRLRYKGESPELQMIDDQIAALEEYLTDLQEEEVFSRAWAANPLYEQLRASLKNLDADIEGTKATLDDRRKAVAEMQTRLLELPKYQAELRRFDRERALVESKLKIIEERMMMADVSIAAMESAPPSIKLVEEAFPPDKKAWPNTKLLLLIAVFLGFVGGLILAIALDLFIGKVTRNRLASVKHTLPIYAFYENSDGPARIRMNAIDLRDLGVVSNRAEEPEPTLQKD